jgi:hypothetical protein
VPLEILAEIAPVAKLCVARELCLSKTSSPALSEAAGSSLEIWQSPPPRFAGNSMSG